MTERWTADLGWDENWARTFDACRCELDDPDLGVGRVTRASRGRCWVDAGGEERAVHIPGRLHRDGAPPVVGDWIAIRVRSRRLFVAAILTRRTAFRRRRAGSVDGEQTVAANIDAAFLVMGLDVDYSPRRLERYLALTYDSGAEPVVVLNKTDLCDDVRARRAEIAAMTHAEVIALSARAMRDGVEPRDRLAPQLAPGRTVALLGSSGVGKSTLVNALLGFERMATNAVRTRDGRGRHTTTHRQLIRLPSGALLVDTPGMRELGLVGGLDALEDAFPDVAELAASCRFTDCRHAGEPGCAVADALHNGTLPLPRWGSYLKLRTELSASAGPRRRS
ncbi:MAG: ribosome small subunit-dependent GTPase A [Myxococcota bacterium]